MTRQILSLALLILNIMPVSNKFEIKKATKTYRIMSGNFPHRENANIHSLVKSSEYLRLYLISF